MRKKILVTIWLVCLFQVNGASSQDVSSVPFKEYEIKAAFIYNFIKFVEWPEDVTNSSREISIAILGRDPFGDILDNLVQEKSIKDKSLRIYRYPEISPAHFYHVLFISESEDKNLKEIFILLKDKSTLTIGESPDFLKQGGIIRLLEDDNRVRFEVDLTHAHASNLKISSRLLRLAENLRDAIAFLPFFPGSLDKSSIIAN